MRTTCQDFLVTLASEIKARFPFNDEKFRALRDLRFLEPVNIVSVKNVARVCNMLGYSEEEMVLTNNEYKSFRLAVRTDTNLNYTDFWREMENSSYTRILHLKNLIQILSHSSASCE